MSALSPPFSVFLVVSNASPASTLHSFSSFYTVDGAQSAASGASSAFSLHFLPHSSSRTVDGSDLSAQLLRLSLSPLAKISL